MPMTWSTRPWCGTRFSTTWRRSAPSLWPSCPALILPHPRPTVCPSHNSAHILDGFDHGAGHPLLFLDDAKAPNCQKNNEFKDLGNYCEWPKVADAVI